MSHSKSISIILQSGNPNGIKIAELANRPFRLYIIPTSKLKEVSSDPKLQKPAIYFLTNLDDTMIYIGETEKVYNRLIEHSQQKDFWDVALVAVGDHNEKSDVKYLESMFIEAAKSANRSIVTNYTVPPRNNLHDFKKPVIEEQFEEISLLISTFGYSFLDKVEQLDNLEEQTVWYLQSKNTNSQGILTDEGFTVLKGSVIAAVSSPSLMKYFPAGHTRRLDNISKHTTINADNSYTLNQNLTFKSLNQATEFCLGRSPNAWMEWKNNQGELIDILRKAA